VTNNQDKNLETRDCHTYLQFTIATGNFWKQRKNVARRGKDLSKDLYFFWKHQVKQICLRKQV